MEFSVIPQPAEMRLHGDRPVFRLTRLCNLHADDESRLAKEELLRFLEKPLELELVGTGKEHLVLRVDKSVSAPEGYTLTVEENRVAVTGHDSAGVFYGVQTLKQLLLQTDGALPAMEIADAPQYSYRGFLLDVSRYFFAPDAVRQLLDAMALHKLNRFHWHLTDDHGWRIELDNWPLLTQIGSMRAYTNFGRHPHGGYYTKDEIRDIVQYAHDRFIRVIPEIDSPGHVVSAIASYPFLSCFDRELPVATNSGVQHDILCVGKETSFDFMFSVLDEAAALFPDGMFHIGGDEVPTMRWDNCPNCQKKMRELGFTSPSQLYEWYIGRITAHLQQKGFQVFAWHNAQLGDGIDPSVIRQHWDVLPGENADLSHVVDADYHSYYFDLPYGMVTLKNCYTHDPAKNGAQPFGAECCLWTEYVPSMQKAGYCAFPRMGAFSETAWTPPEKKNYAAFLKKLPAYFRLLDAVSLPHATKKQALPSFIRNWGYQAWFWKRNLHALGLKKALDDRKVARKARQSQQSSVDS